MTRFGSDVPNLSSQGVTVRLRYTSKKDPCALGRVVVAAHIWPILNHLSHAFNFTFACFLLREGGKGAVEIAQGTRVGPKGRTIDIAI